MLAALSFSLVTVIANSHFQQLQHLTLYLAQLRDRFTPFAIHRDLMSLDSPKDIDQPPCRRFRAFALFGIER